MNYAIIAAGEGSRLAQEGVAKPKPLVELQGEPMIGRLINIMLRCNAESISIIVNKWGDGPHAIVCLVIFKGANVSLEIVLLQDGIDCRQAEFALWNHAAQVPQAVHRARGCLDHKLEWNWQFEALQGFPPLGYGLMEQDADAPGIPARKEDE